MPQVREGKASGNKTAGSLWVPGNGLSRVNLEPAQGLAVPWWGGWWGSWPSAWASAAAGESRHVLWRQNPDLRFSAAAWRAARSGTEGERQPGAWQKAAFVCMAKIVTYGGLINTGIQMKTSSLSLLPRSSRAASAGCLHHQKQQRELFFPGAAGKGSKDWAGYKQDKMTYSSLLIGGTSVTAVAHTAQKSHSFSFLTSELWPSCLSRFFWDI